MLSIYKALEFFNITPESLHEDLSHQSKNKNPKFIHGYKNKEDDHLQEPLLNRFEDQSVGEIKCVKQHNDPNRCYSSDPKVNLRVKIKMTKEEARRLMAKCKDQKGRLEFRDVALELVKIPTNRIIEVSPIE